MTASNSGTEECKIRLTNAEGISGSEHSFNLTSSGEVITEASGGVGEVILWSSLFIIIVGGSLAIVLILRSDDKSKKAYTQMQVAQYQQAYAAQVHQQQVLAAPATPSTATPIS